MAEQATQKRTRKERKGKVISKSGDKSIVVQVEARRRHPLYAKVVRFSSRFHVHDESNQAKVGDEVHIVESRPISKLKRWRLLAVTTKQNETP
ncbi:MAG: 30S ribosomal protein S17 [Verrucomicrobia bacterium]|nr:30S ribosomal protein S17 [Verrucomicrobiota bacterium]